MELVYILNIFLVLTIRNVLVSALTSGFCSRIQRSKSDKEIFYYTTYFCCQNFEKVDGYCTECSPGFVSREGGACYPCPRWTYGYRCMSWCMCTENQRCHNVYGCIEDIQSRTEIYSTEEVTTMTLTTEHSVQTTEHSVQTAGMVKTEVFIVSLFGVGTIIILCFSIGCFCVYKKYHKANVNPNSDTDQNIGVNNHIYEVDNTVERDQLVSRERATDNEYIAML